MTALGDKAGVVDRKAAKQQRAVAVVRDVIRSGGTDKWSHLSSHGHSFSTVWGCFNKGWITAHGRYHYSVTDKGRAMVEAAEKAQGGAA